MASSNCWRCLSRPSLAILPVAPRRVTPVLITGAVAASAPFSTTVPSYAVSPDAGLGKHVRAGKKMRLGKFKKQKNSDRAKPALPGERKAFRKRIQLSNNNALVVPGLPELSAEVLANPESAGQVYALPAKVIDQLRLAEAFKPSQCWNLFREPHVLVRAETVDLMRKLNNAAEKKEGLRMVITGEKLAGKSILLLQALANAYMNNWVVINIPEAQELTTACTEYSPIPNSSPQKYSQPTYILRLLQSIFRNHDRVLSQYTMSKKHSDLPPNLHAGANLAHLVSSAKEGDYAWPVFRAFLAEMTNPGVPRPPMLLALDGLAHIMRISDYRSPAFELIHSHDFALVGAFVDVLNGTVPLPHGGAVLAACSRGNAPRSPSMDLAIAQREAEQQPEGSRAVPPPAEPYFRGYDARVEAALASARILRLGGISKQEARSLMEYWAASGMLRATVDERTVSEKWTLAGNGVLGEMERASLLTMRL